MTPDYVMNTLDSFIYRVRARTNPPRDPDVLTVTMQQYDVLEKWGAKRPQQTKVVVDADGHMKYKGIRLKVK